ncbi:MAG: glycosyltransferase family 39 protein [Actinomycetota bacterium]
MSTTPEEPEQSTYLLVVLGAGVVLLWIAPIFSSFWLDETITAWIVDDGFGEMLRRAFDHQPMFPTYYMVAWVARSVGGASEWVLRIPSLLAMALASVALARLGTRLFDRETGLLAAIVFAISAPGAYAATDARPYALGLLALVVATLLLVRWLDTRNRWAAAGFAVAAALVVYVHYLLAAALVAHVVYAVRRRRAVGWAALLAVGVGFLVLLLPLAPWFLDTYDRRSSLSLTPGTLRGVALSLAPPTIVAALLIGAFLSGRAVRAEATDLRAGRDELLLLATWASAPPILLFVASRVTGTGVFTPRYLLSALPAIALLAGAGIRMLRPARARRTTMAIFFFLTVLVVGSIAHTTDAGRLEDWRGAARAANALVTDPTTPVILQSGLIESGDVELLTDPEWLPYLLAPTTPYPIGGRIMAAPFDISAPEQGYLEELSRRLEGATRVVFVSRESAIAVLGWVEGRLAASGFRSRLIGRFGDLAVVTLERSTS